jgi:hypothetical protein
MLSNSSLLKAMPPPVPPERERGAYYNGKSEPLNCTLRLADVADNFSSRGFEADRFHRLLEEQTVLGHIYGFGFGADHLDLVLVENPPLRKVDRDVQRGLPAHGRQKRIRPFPLDDRSNEIRGEGLDVCAIRRVRDPS